MPLEVERLLASGAVVIAVGGRPLRVAAASAAALAVFRAADDFALTEKLFGSGQPGGHRLAQLAESLPRDASARLEQLRFFVGGRSLAAAFSCRKVELPGEDFLLLAVAPAATQRVVAGEGAVLRKHRAEAASASAPRALSSDRARTSPVLKRVRFTWRADAEKRLTWVDSELARRVGTGASLSLGDPLPQRLRELGVDPGGRIAAAMSAGTTWSRIDLRWPAAGQAGPLRVELAGSPVHDSSGKVLGYSGFGTIQIEPVVRPAVASPQAEATPSAACIRSGPAESFQAEPAAETSPGHESFRQAVASVFDPPRGGGPQSRGLTATEHSAFKEVARDLQARLGDEPTGASDRSAGDRRAADHDSGAAGEGSAARRGHPDHLAVLERLPIGVLIARGGDLLYVNRTLLDLLGHDDLQAFRAAGGLDAMLCGQASAVPGPAGERAFPIARGDGEVLMVDAHLQAVTWRGAAAIQICVRRSLEAEIATRITGARSAWEALEQENAELRAVLETATDGVAVLDHGGRILSINRSGEALFGLDGGEVTGEPFTVLIAPESRARALEYFGALAGSGVASVMNDGREMIGRTGQGGLIPLFLSIGQLPDNGTARYCAVLRDLTPWKRLERDLDEARRAAERANQLKTDFLARVSHEIRTPLNTILGFAEIMIDERFGPAGNERYEHYLRDIHASGLLVLNTVSRLLDLSKVESGWVDLLFASVNANSVVSDCVTQVRAEADRHRVILRLALAPRLPEVVADDRSLRQIILAILSNAIKFNTAGGQVIVSTALTDGGDAVVRIRDTGSGMSEAEIKAALEPFRHFATSRSSPGLGLGLPLAKALADANRTALSIKSKKNEGTLVEVTFPAARVLSS